MLHFCLSLSLYSKASINPNNLCRQFAARSRHRPKLNRPYKETLKVMNLQSGQIPDKKLYVKLESLIQNSLISISCFFSLMTKPSLVNDDSRSRAGSSFHGFHFCMWTKKVTRAILKLLVQQQGFCCKTAELQQLN